MFHEWILTKYLIFSDGDSTEFWKKGGRGRRGSRHPAYTENVQKGLEEAEVDQISRYD